MIVELPYPDKNLNPNKRLHPMQLARFKRVAKELAYWDTRGVLMQYKSFTAPVNVKLTFYPPDRRKRDDDNAIAAFKAYRDGVAMAIGVDDGDWITDYQFRHQALNKVVVEIRQGEEEKASTKPAHSNILINLN